MLPLLALLSPAWGAEVLALVEVSDAGPRLVSAQIVAESTRSPARPDAALGALAVLDAQGRPLASAEIPDPRRRSVIFPEGGGASWTQERGLVHVRLPWPEDAARLSLGGLQLSPLGPPPPSQLTALIETGPAAERLDMLILGDGYTAEQEALFAADAERMMAHLLGVEPYGDYAGLINAWILFTPSAESGVSHYEDSPRLLRDSYYSCYYGCGGVERAVCCDDEAVLSEIGAALPDAEGVVVLINDPEYGGAGGFQYATSYTADPWGEYVFAHELGHSLIGLWDEYSYGYENTGEGPNCKADPAGEGWSQWLDEARVSAFRPCTYENLYRPTDAACMMNVLQDDYCPVCREQVVLGIYGRLPALIQGAEPAPGPVELDEATLFTVTLLSAVDGLLERRWTLEGEALGDEEALILEPCGPSGELVHEAWDPSPWVRLDPEGLTRDQVSWQITRPLCADSGLDSSVGPEEKRRGGCACGSGGPAGGGWLVMLGIVAILLRGRLH
ncbi:MAG: hypothetical protein H6741_03675 [Alphaproteobacteria bacterium]|nr:hypothetical protein [Alphaproteobacteria bacterium]